jgi:hypothetical protein
MPCEPFARLALCEPRCLVVGLLNGKWAPGPIFWSSEAGCPIADRCNQGDAADNDSERVQNGPEIHITSFPS